jgi:HAD superfamily phosphoserine phosphatase-like hydrolase
VARRLVSLDLDGTLIHPAIFNVVADGLDFGAPLRHSYQEYVAGRISLEDAFHHDYKHFVGKPVSDMHRVLHNNPAWTPGIAGAVGRLHDAGLRVIVTTDQPRFLVETTRRFGIDDLVCSEAEIRNDRVTGHVRPEFQKWPNLERYLKARRIDPKDVAHVGNGTNDIPVFERVGFSVGVNALHPSVNAAAKATIARVEDFGEVANIILDHL